MPYAPEFLTDKPFKRLPDLPQRYKPVSARNAANLANHRMPDFCGHHAIVRQGPDCPRVYADIQSLTGCLTRRKRTVSSRPSLMRGGESRGGVPGLTAEMFE